MFYRRDRPGSSVVTVALLVLWLLLALYLITHPDLISIIVLIVTAIIAAFAVVITLMLRRAERGRYDDLTYGPASDMANGHHRNPPLANDVVESDANAAQREIPDEGGEN